MLCPPHRAVLVACGAAKLPAERLGADGGAPAGQMYTGAYHRSCRAAAAALAGEHSRTWILSARHGLLSLDRRIRSYNQRLGQKGSVTASRLREQVQREGLDEAEVLVLGGGDYSRLVTTVLPDALPVLQGRGGMLSQRRYCAELVGDRSLRHAVWAEAARRTLRGVSQVPCPRCRLRHGRVDAADLLPGDAITLDGHTLLVVSSSPAGYGQVVHAAAGSPALKRLRFGARQGVDVRRPAHPRAVIGPLFCSEQGSTR
ncbi:DUF6884 domain-containing protein [Streptomyces xinghaiensis]|uniref:DUF6884 domain-containing protein n=1 Tax=Streptomyces xinghaiensis TaxID=1038928 RepID=UPI0002DA02CB|nr:DUF6884 domain-containing protein [Streptomyces xinghaiensis]MZE80916.1 hypothetical protein [Streptomyces sp. SID5475]